MPTLAGTRHEPVIEHNVPMPKRYPVRYPFRKLELRDSFAVPINLNNSSLQLSSLQRLRRYYEQWTGRKFRIALDEKGLDWRVWRIR
jgi:hypothetical protein